MSKTTVSRVPARANAVLSPSARNHGPDRPPVAAEDITTGTSGQTHGERMLSTPATPARGIEAASRLIEDSLPD